MVVVSNYNSFDQFVISGYKRVVEAACERLKARGARIIPLNVSAPFHSPLMQLAADNMKGELVKYKFSELKYPIISNVSALPYQTGESIRENLFNQMIKPVRWKATIDYMVGQGINIAIEMGPKTVLRNLMRKNALGINAFSYDKASDVEEMRVCYKEQDSISLDNVLCDK